MVLGEKLLMKLLILSRLMERNEWHIKELIRETGISSERLNKLLRELSKNYLMTYDESSIVWNPADIPSTLKPWGWRLYHYPVLGSTQDAARGHGPWSIVIAEYLIEAKGRHGRSWKANLGGIWATISLQVPSEWAPLLPIAASVIVAKTLNSLYKINAKIKWPNDIVVNGSKIAGILVEAEAFPNSFIAYIGIGINVNNNPGVEGAIALKDLVGLKPRNQLLASLIGRFSRMGKIVDEKEKLIKTYKEYLDTLGRKVIVETHSGVIEGIAEDLRDDGSIVIASEGRELVFDPITVLRLRYKD